MNFNINQELFPAIRSNLLLFKEKSKRISTAIGAREEVFRRSLKIKEKKNARKQKLSGFVSLRESTKLKKKETLRLGALAAKLPKTHKNQQNHLKPYNCLKNFVS